MKQGLAFVISFFITVVANSVTSLPQRTVMVQLFEWPWSDIARECENTLGPAGFSAVQISPPQEHLSLGQNSWWERYQPVSYQLTSRSGTEQELAAMISRCQKAGVDVYVDVVLNHMAGISSGVGFAGTPYTKYNHAGLYSFHDFHHCGRNGNDQLSNSSDRYELQNCELLGLADLKTDSPKVQQTLVRYIEHLVNLGAKGFRIDAAKHINAEEIHSIFSQLKASVYLISEVFLGPGEPVSLQEYRSFSDVNVFEYAFHVGECFQRSISFQDLLGRLQALPSSQDAVVFIENHDLERSPRPELLHRSSNSSNYDLATAFMLTWPYGYPQIYSGFQFQNFDEGPRVDARGKTYSPLKGPSFECSSDWACQHRAPGVSKLVLFRNFTNSFFAVTDLWLGSTDQIAFGRGPLGFVVLNNSDSTLKKQFTVSLPDGPYCNILDSKYNLQSRSCQHPLQVLNKKVFLNVSAHDAVVLLKNELELKK